MNAPHQNNFNLEMIKLERLTAEDWQQHSLDALFTVASALSAGLSILDTQLQCVRSNSAMAEMNQLPLESHAGRSLATLLPDLAPVLQPVCQQVFQTQEPVTNFEVKGRTSIHSEEQTWLISCLPINGTQDVVGVLMLKTSPVKRSKPLQSLQKHQIALTHQQPQHHSDPISLEILQQQFERERLINKVAMQILQSDHLQDIFNIAVGEVRQFLQADRVVIGRRQLGGSHTVVAESVVEGWQPCLGSTLPESWMQILLQSQQLPPQLAKSVLGASNPDLQQWETSVQIKSRLAMPILMGDQVWGAVAVHQCTRVRQWQPSEVELLERLATQLAIAIQQAELHERIQGLNDQLESQVQARTTELQVAFEFEATLKRITDRVRDSLDEDQILQAAVRELVLVLKISCCNASLYDVEAGTSTTCYEYTTSMSPYQGRVSKFSAVPELYNQLSQGQYFQFCSLVPNPERGLSSMLACPILDDQGVIGDLWLIHHKYYAFNDQDIRLVQQVANQCAIAIRQARLYEKSQTQVKELERLNQLKDDFLSTVSHELRTPLSNIKMAIHMLRTAPTVEKRDRYMAILEAECSRETELINDLLDLQKLENDSYMVSLETIELKSWLPSVIAPFVSRANNRQQTLEVDLPSNMPLLMSDRKSLERILAELLNNACKYTPPEGKIRLQVLHPMGAEATTIIPVTTFIVSNQATVSPDELPRIFEKFYRIPKSDPWQQGGTGLGLALVQKLVETLQGSISATSNEGWTALSVALPLPVKGSGKE